MKVESIDHGLLKVLSATCIDPQLQSLLLFDCQFDDLQSTAQILQALLQETYACTVSSLFMNPTVNEDSLWGQWVVSNNSNQLQWQAGLLQPLENEIRIIKVADLSSLNLIASRAILSTANRQPVSLQRHGQNLSYTPKIFYLAALPSKNSSALLSAHLLARFNLRLHIKTHLQRNGIEYLQHALDFDSRQEKEVELSDKVKKDLHQAQCFQAQVDNLVFAQALVYFKKPDHRRELNLSRLAIAFSRFSQVELRSSHIRQAALLLGLKNQPDMNAPEVKQDHFDERESLLEKSPLTDESLDSSSTVDDKIEKNESSSAYESPGILQNTYIPLLLVDDAYPEDNVIIQHDPAPLQLPLSIQQHANDKGVIIGTQSSDNLQDIAWLASLLEAVKFQHKGSRGKLKLLGNHLKKYRRVAVAEQLFILVLDYTSLKGCQWQQALMPHLRFIDFKFKGLVMNTYAINRIDINHKLEQIPDEALDKINLYLDTLLTSAIQKKTCSLKGIWQDMSFEEMDVELEIKGVRQELSQAILERKL